MQSHILRKRLILFVDIQSITPILIRLRARPGLDQPKPCMLKEMWPKVKSSPSASFIARADERTSEDHLMAPIKTGSTKVVIDRVNLETLQGVEGVLGPLPDIPKQVVNP
jgi:hypothetical protein